MTPTPLSLPRSTARAVAIVGIATAVATAVPCAAQRGAPIDADALPAITARQDLRIGSASDPKIGFSAILAIDVDAAGQMYVYDRQASEIRVYSREGRPVRTIGRAGPGPGEFGGVTAMGVVGDTVWTFDANSLRVNVFRRNGSVVASHVMQRIPSAALHAGALGRLMPYALRPDGRFVVHLAVEIVGGDAANRMAAAAGVTNRVRDADTVMVPRLLLSPTGAVLDTVGWEPVPPRDAPVVPMPMTRLPSGEQQFGVYVEGGGGRFSVPQPPQEYYLRTTTTDGSALVMRRRPTSARPAEFEFVRFDLAGKPLHRVRFRFTPSRYAGAVLDTIAMRPVAARPPQSPDAAFKAVRAALKYPEFQSGVFAIWASNDGSVWLRREDNAGPRHRWIAIERNGTVRGMIELPRSVRPAWSNGEMLVGVDIDNAGIPWVVRYVMRKA